MRGQLFLLALLCACTVVVEPCPEKFVDCRGTGAVCDGIMRAEADGWDCRRQEHLYNAFGGWLGVRWRCEMCDA